MGFHSCGGLPVAASSASVPHKHYAEETSSVTPLIKVFVVIVIDDDS